MDDRLANLEQRVAELEKEVRELKADPGPPWNETSEQRGARLLRQVRSTSALTKEELDHLLHRLGLAGVPVMTPEELQQEFLKAGIRPEDNSFSRGIIEMREE